MSYSNKIQNFAPTLVLFDILFLPFLNFYTIPVSLFVIVYFLCKEFFNSGIEFNLDFFLIIIILTCLLITFYLSVISLNEYNIDLFSNNNLRILQVIIGFLYYLYFCNFTLSKDHLEKILMFFFTYLFFILLLYLFAENLYFYIKSFFSHSLTGQHSRLENYNHSRLSYYFQNPNLFGYFLLSIFIFSIFSIKSVSKKIYIFLVTIFILYFVQSRGVLLSGLFTIFYILVFIIFKKNFKYKKAIICFLIFTIVMTFIFILKESNDRFSIENFLDAINKRTLIYQLFINYNNFLPKLFEIGMMGTGPVGSHSDLLNILFSYGILFTVFFIIFIFRNLFSLDIRFVFLIPIFTSFLIDSFMLDNKIYILSMILLATSRKNFNDH